jgi:hypothetical protein
VSSIITGSGVSTIVGILGVEILPVVILLEISGRTQETVKNK